MSISGVNVFGPVKAASGLGTAVRGHLRAMKAAGIPARVFPLVFSSQQDSVPFEQAADDAFHDVSLFYATADATDFLLANYGRDLKRSKYRIGVWVWELAAAHPGHFERARIFDEIWVPSTFNQRAFSAITRSPVQLVPYVVEPAEGAGDFRGRLGIAPDAFVYLYMLDASSYVTRKNPQALLEAFSREFAGDRTATLVLKVSNLDRESAFARELAAAERKIPNLRCIRETLDEAEVASLLRMCDCYVSPHRSEGFGLTVAEAMALAKPVVATDYGSTCDFLDAEVAYPVPYRLVEIEADLGPYFAGAVWADVDPGALAREMRRVRAEPAMAHAKAEKARSRIAERYSLAAITRVIASRLSALELPQ
jgi:glycosyltransferase involved in cell wall biosynthesis